MKPNKNKYDRILTSIMKPQKLIWILVLETVRWTAWYFIFLPDHTDCWTRLQPCANICLS